MSDNKTIPTSVSVESFLESVSDARRKEAHVLMSMMERITGNKPVMWGPSIIGFGSMHYKYETGREGDMPILACSPRKASVTVYFNGFDQYDDLLKELGRHKLGQSCLYITKLTDVDLGVLQQMLQRSFASSTGVHAKPTSVDEYVASIPIQSRPRFDELRSLVQQTLPNAEEVLSYGIIGYKIDQKRARVYISGWKDHVAMYPVPKDEDIQRQLKPYIKGRSTLWFGLDEPLPVSIIDAAVRVLVS